MNRRDLMKSLIAALMVPAAFVARTSIYDIARRGGSILIGRFRYRVGVRGGYVHHTKIGGKR